MEVRIGIKDSGRDISLESPLDSQAIQAAVKHGLADGTIELSDSKGRMFIVPAQQSPLSKLAVKMAEGLGSSPNGNLDYCSLWIVTGTSCPICFATIGSLWQGSPSCHISCGGKRNLVSADLART